MFDAAYYSRGAKSTQKACELRNQVLTDVGFAVTAGVGGGFIGKFDDANNFTRTGTPWKLGGVLGHGHNAANFARFKEHLRQWAKYGKAGVRELDDGRIRYYGVLTPAVTPGQMAGRRLVREWNPMSGGTRTWIETLDHQGRVRIVRPERCGSKIHYTFDAMGKFTGTF